MKIDVAESFVTGFKVHAYDRLGPGVEGPWSRYPPRSSPYVRMTVEILVPEGDANKVIEGLKEVISNPMKKEVMK